MSAETKKEIQLEIAHVLFVDIVGYSKLSINEQRAAIDELNEIVRASEQFQKAEAADRLIKIATGDGMALVFYTSPEAPAQCAIEISRALKEHPRLQLRMGVHSGPVSGVIDVTGRANLTGAGLNMANRVMSCGDAGHILVSKRIAEDLGEYEHWRPFLHDLGACEVKHGVRIGVVSLYDNRIGNPALPKKFQALKKRRAHVRWAEATIALLLLGAVVAAFVLVLRRPVRSVVAAAEKSIAVLPFENLSRDPDNAYFATGIQDEILTRLAKIGALKVISHNSTQQYAARPGNLPEIARQLGVANILEGSVQKAADQVHINVQLIRAATDEHLWAESYDRKLENIFGVEAEVATAVAEALKAKLTGAEQQAIEQKPTNNLEAYDAYLRGLAYALRSRLDSDTLDAIKYFSEAVELDPKFALAWTWLAKESALAYFNDAGTDVPGLRETAKRAAEKIAELQPNRGEAYLAKGYYEYYCDRDYDSAIASFDKARQLSPNNSDILQALGLIWRRKGEWQLSLKYLQEAIDLDPRNISLLTAQAEVYSEFRKYSAALKGYDRILEISPDNAFVLASKARTYQAKGDLPAAATLLSRIHIDPSSELFDVQVQQWMYERRYVEAIDVLEHAIAGRGEPLRADWQRIYYLSILARLQQFSGDMAHAGETWRQVKTDTEKLRGTKGERFMLWAIVEAYAALGDKTKALATVEHATALFPVSDPINVRYFSEIKSTVAVQARDKDLAIEQLAISARSPVGVDYGDLKFNPLWDPLRGDPRFEKIVSSLEPK
jgi:TolB-like protein/class 3 adenylate cyclase/cytochrome c-type biogenesis protein CcmH/NrfG